MSFPTHRERLTRSATVEAPRTETNPYLAVTWAVASLLARAARFLARWAWWLRSELAVLVIPLAVGFVVARLMERVNAPLIVAHLLAVAAALCSMVVGVRALAGRYAVVRERRRCERLVRAVRRDWPHVMRA